MKEEVEEEIRQILIRRKCDMPNRTMIEIRNLIEEEFEKELCIKWNAEH